MGTKVIQITANERIINDLKYHCMTKRLKIRDVFEQALTAWLKNSNAPLPELPAAAPEVHKLSESGRVKLEELRTRLRKAVKNNGQQTT